MTQAAKALTKSKLTAREWAEALRSGKYRQASAELVVSKNKKNSYCCLGVLCSIGGLNRMDNGFEFDGNKNESDLSRDTLNYFGLSEKTMLHLIDMNDGNDEKGTPKQNFKQIAYFIEKKVKLNGDRK